MALCKCNCGKVHPSQPLPVCKGEVLGERLRVSLPENVYIFCPKAVIYIAKRDDEDPPPFRMGAPSPVTGFHVTVREPGGALHKSRNIFLEDRVSTL